MLCSVETAWLFTRGPDSVRVIRGASRAGGMRLIVHGPGESGSVRDFTDVVACMNYQADLERRLVAEGFTLERFTSDRRAAARSSPDAPDRRRPLRRLPS